LSATESNVELRERPAQDVNKMLADVRKMVGLERKRERLAKKNSFATRSLRGLSFDSAQTEDRTVIRKETLKKQGGRVKSWHTRVFCLRRTGIYYYRDESEFIEGNALGRILFGEMITIGGHDTPAQLMPSGINLLLGLRHVFVVHTELRTYVVAAPSREAQQAWVDDINAAFETFQQQYKRKNRLLGEVWRIGGDEETYSAAQQLTKGGTEVESVLEEMLDMMYDQFAKDVSLVYAELNLRKIFLRWKTFHRYRVSNGEETKDHRSFFARRLSVRKAISKSVVLKN